MAIIKHYEIEGQNGLAWYGLPRRGCPEHVTVQLRAEGEVAHSLGAYSERECEVDCFLTVLESAPGPVFNLIDLGAGWGEWSLALAGAINHRLVLTKCQDYRTTAVECDSYYYEAALQNFVRTGIKDKAATIMGVVGAVPGRASINTGRISRRCCGASLSFHGRFRGSVLLAVALGIGHAVRRCTVSVPMFTVDGIVAAMRAGAGSDIDLIAMDIQGAELLALEGARDTIAEEAARWWLIGTHGQNIHNKVKELLSGYYDLVVDALPGCVTEMRGGYRVFIAKGQDGVQLWKRRGITG